MKWNIVLDSSSDAFKNRMITDEIGLTVVPLKINAGDKVYVDDENLDLDSLIADMEDKNLSTGTACPAPQDFADAFEKGDNVICMTIAGGSSGTYNCACLAKDMVLEKYPDKKIAVIDTHSTGGVLQIVQRKAVELIEQGVEFDEIEKQLKEYTLTVKVEAILGSFVNLVKNGRMSGFAAAAANVLNIKVIAGNTPDGIVVAEKKVRGEKKVFAGIIERMKDFKEMKDTPVIISHCRCLEKAEAFKELLEKEYGYTQVEITECRGLTTYYCMPGGFIVAF